MPTNLSLDKTKARNKLRAFGNKKIRLKRDVFFVPGWTDQACLCWTEPYTEAGADKGKVRMLKFDFDNSAIGLSLLNALSLAEIADLVYGDLSQIQKTIIENFGFLKYKPFDSHDTQAFVCSNDEIIIVAFRGTTNLTDLRTDARAKLVPSRVGRIHQGFNEALNWAWNDLRKTIIDFRNNEQSIWITGHSLGGALATLAADRLIGESIKVKGLYTFGQPRVGDKIFASNFDSDLKGNSFRFVHDEDIVSKIPPSLQGYQHIGTECYFDCNGVLYTDKIGWRKLISRCTSVAIRSSEDYDGLKAENPGGIRDHGLGYYKRCIRENYIKTKGIARTFSDYINS